MARQQGHLFPWVPVFYGLGVGGYFALLFEPGVSAWGAVTLGLVSVAILLRLAPWAAQPLLWAMLLVLAGFSVA